MDPIVEEFTITLKYQVTVDTETGEMTTKCIKRTVDKTNFEVSEKKTAKKKVVEDNSSPQLTLEDNKYRLNTAAIELMGVSAESKIDIKYEKQGKSMIPVIGTDEAFGTRGGNRLTKSNTVACRGSKHEELVKYGNIFQIIPHDSKAGLFILKGDAQIDTLDGDENVSIDEEIDISQLIDDKDVEEINSFDFTL